MFTSPTCQLKISFNNGIESVESLDIWPPVIPPQTELIFIVADKPKPASVDREDFGVDCVQDGLTDSVTKNIKMTKKCLCMFVLHIIMYVWSYGDSELVLHI